MSALLRSSVAPTVIVRLVYIYYFLPVTSSFLPHAIHHGIIPCLCTQEKEKQYMLPLEGLQVRDLEGGLFKSKHMFALYNPTSR